MRNRVILALSVVLSFSTLFSPLAFAQSRYEHGGLDYDPTFDANATTTVDTLEGRQQSLVPLDSLIAPEALARIEAQRDLNLAYLDRLARQFKREAGVDLRYRDTEVKKQFGGTCTAFGLIGSIENLLGGQIDLSERHFWSEYHTYSCESALKAASNSWGVVELDWWPDSNRHPFVGYLDQPWFKLTQFEALDSDISKAVASLDAGHPVYIAISTPTDMMNCPVHIDPNTDHYKSSGHALAVVGYQLDPATPGGGSFLLKNSWGPKCGDKGYQWYPFNLCTKKGMYCQFWSIQGAHHD